MGFPAEAVMFVTDRRRLVRGSLAGLVHGLAQAGLDLVQVREKDLLGRALLELVREVVAAARKTATRVLVNGRPDVAVAAGAHGVQLPESGLPPSLVRQAFPSLVVGVSCHTPEAVWRAAAEGAHFALLGPIFATPGKEDRVLGVGTLRVACRSATIPVVAVGGIDASTSPMARDAGAAGVAAIRHFFANEPAVAVNALRARETAP